MAEAIVLLGVGIVGTPFAEGELLAETFFGFLVDVGQVQQARLKLSRWRKGLNEVMALAGC